MGRGIYNTAAVDGVHLEDGIFYGYDCFDVEKRDNNCYERKAKY